MKTFEHYAPDSIEELLEMLKSKPNAKLIAGGTDLLLQMKQGTAQPETVISLKNVEELRGFSVSKNGYRLGAGMTLRGITRSNELTQNFPGLVYAAGVVASEQIRTLATLGGNICNASPSADMVPPLIALDAVVQLVSNQGQRDLSLSDFFKGPGESVLKSGEIMHSIFLPQPSGNMIYSKHAPRKFMDLAVVSVAVRLAKKNGKINEARVALGAVGPVPFRAEKTEALLAGQTLTTELMLEAGEMAAGECVPIDDIRGSAWYRKRMVKVHVRRNLETLR
ncbi:MAG: xanthine dehydrogenase family protein subunit M [SAR324 cluster bacterium]|jgi:carbon-monoxide dehydrogenase medium subunit|nr:xanthine dehydrogenase family protein subunit M [SAR324 cluster bacterium]